jgi:hypothetical protein
MVKCQHRQCANWDDGVCRAQDIIVDGKGTCLTQREETSEILDGLTSRRSDWTGTRRSEPVVDADTEDDDWLDDDLLPDHEAVDDDDDDWDDDEWADDELPRRL